MLPAANRQKGKEFLRMFKDAGRYPSFFPDGDDLLSDGRVMETYPDLECNVEGGTIKHSLFNVLKMRRPVVVLDEAHKAYGSKKKEANEEFTRSINRLNPRVSYRTLCDPEPWYKQSARRYRRTRPKKRGDDQIAGAGDIIPKCRVDFNARAGG